MANLLLIADTHFGVRGNSEHFHNNMKLFYENVFFPLLEKVAPHIDGIIHLGDVFDDRRKIDINTARLSREYFFLPLYKFLNKHDLEMHIICGNHDSYFRDELTTNSLQEFIENQVYDLTGRKPFRIHTTCEVIDKWDSIFVPWITKSNRAYIEKAMSITTAKYAFGHFELNGFNFSKVQTATHGDDPKNLLKFNSVFSGHYHYRHSKGNIHYLGSPTQHTWIDVDTTRGVHIFDTKTGMFRFIENPYNIFANVNFGSELHKMHPQFVRLYREGTEKQSDVDDYVKKLYQAGAITVDIIVKNNGNKALQGITESEDTIETVEDTPVFIRNNVEDETVATILVNLYNRAVSQV